MKRLAVAASMMCAVVFAVPAAAQQKLGDVAGSIKLKKSGEESVVIDGSDVGQTSRRSASTSESDLMYDIMSDCLDEARGLSAMVEKLPRIIPVRYTEDFKTQLAAVGERLDELDLELQMIPDAGPNESAYLKAVEGFDKVRQGYSEVLAASNTRQLVTTEQKRMITDGGNAIDEAMASVRSISRSQAAGAPPPPIDPIAAAESIRKVCSRYGSDGSPAFEDCVSKQDAAKNALIGRTGPAVGLDTEAFNKIRNGCLYEWPDNYVNRNACETRRAAAASGG